MPLYEDGLFSGLFFVTRSRINFTITNKTDHSIRIIWDEAAFIDVDGQSGRVAHEGVKYADRNASQPPIVIPRGTSLTDFVLPTGRLYLVLPASLRIAAGVSGAGLEHSGPDLQDRLVDGFASEVGKNKGKRFGFLLPLEIEGIVNEYTFWFEVQEASVCFGSN